MTLKTGTPAFKVSEIPSRVPPRPTSKGRPDSLSLPA